MSLRFRKRIKVLPGFYINIGNSGISTTIGPRGANVNIGKNGSYVNLGIPGTGLSSRHKVSDLLGNADPTVEDSPTIEASEAPIETKELTTVESMLELKKSMESSREERRLINKDILALKEEITQIEKKLERKKFGFFSFLASQGTIDELETSLNQLKEKLTEAEEDYLDARVDIITSFDNNLSDQYNEVIKAFQNCATSNKIWDITSESKNADSKSSANSSVSRSEVSFSVENIDFINSEFPGLHFANANGSQIYLYPGFILLMQADGQFDLIDISELKFKFKGQRFLEQKETIPADSEIIDHTWAKVNKDGSPDRRFVDNYEIPVVKYGELSLETKSGLFELYHISNLTNAETFANAFLSYLAEIPKSENSDDIGGGTNSVINEKEFQIVKEFGDKHTLLLEKLAANEGLGHMIQDLGLADMSEFENPGELIHFYFVVDLVRCFLEIADVNEIKSKKAFALLYTIGRKNGLEIDQYSQHHILYGDKMISSYESVIKSIDSNYDRNNSERFKLSGLLANYDKDLNEDYLQSLYRFTSIISKIDGTISESEQNFLASIMTMENHISGKDDLPLDSEKKVPKMFNTASDKETIESTLKELNDLVGLDDVKEEINTLINFIKVQKAREENGLRSNTISYHIVFTGNPGTGKTTVARLVARIYKELGILKKGHLVETDRSGLIAEYVGQTAIKVNKLIDSALDGVLFIDEAYALVGDGDDSFGKEAVSTLIKRMEDDRERLVVALAGYTEEMRKFIDTNPGFQSRFNRYIEFKDYTPDEMVAIYQRLCTKHDYKASDTAIEKLKAIFESAYEKRDRSFGNGRFVRNIFEKSMENQANRLASETHLTNDLLTLLTDADVINN